MTTAPVKEAIRLTKVLDAYHSFHGGDRFPVDVCKLALECADFFNFPDPITEVQGADIAGFDGGLFRKGDSWLLLYNDNLSSEGRIRFTQAHELGHYVLHRADRDAFQCGNVGTAEDQKSIEIEADQFAAHLLMPLHDFRAQLTSQVDLNVLGDCAERYGVSLTAIIHQWLNSTDEKAILIISREGFMLTAKASDPAHKAGVFFRTRRETIEIPSRSLTANPLITSEKQGQLVPANIWFPNASSLTLLREMKLVSDTYDTVLTLLLLPRTEDVWAPRPNGGCA
ncbi:ImmA/IrrE family metallo-endopeptidase [Pandoraea apista]|uniref:ImmA/IrrE family metallo-endopeptidase n=1 Tax=Pandoraea apista TaxID=93218 RepID=UPI00248D4BE6|nr:ImmA/IrrE family metallo-endopeptidase [Pandoraea apista]